MEKQIKLMFIFINFILYFILYQPVMASEISSKLLLSACSWVFIGNRISSILYEIDGIKNVQVNLDNLIVEIVYDDEETSIENIKSKLNSNGYPVTDVTNNTDTYVHSHISAQEAKTFMDTNPEVIILDVREEFEYCGDKHIPRAVNYPWNSGVLIEKYNELPIDKDILVVCRSGRRSHRASNFLDSKGFSSIIEIEGGMYQWMWDKVNCQKVFTLQDVLVYLQILSGISASRINYSDYDFNDNGKIEISEALYALQKVSDVR